MQCCEYGACVRVYVVEISKVHLELYKYKTDSTNYAAGNKENNVLYFSAKCTIAAVCLL